MESASKGEKERKNDPPGTLMAVAGTTKTEITGENRLANIASDLKHLRATLRFTVELEDEPGVRFGPDIYMKLRRRRALRILTDRGPPIVENNGPRFCPLEIQRHADLP